MKFMILKCGYQNGGPKMIMLNSQLVKKILDVSYQKPTAEKSKMSTEI
jgi:predicted nucleic-acid-binding Zn-ribbon protein